MRVIPSITAGCPVLYGLLSALALVAGCSAPPPALPLPDTAPADFPKAIDQDASGQGAIYAIDADRSLVAIRVYRDGALARMGHDHVIAARNVGGLVAIVSRGDDTLDVRADLFLPLGGVTVDEPALRDAAGFDSEPSAEDREGTRRNMLTSLEASEYPYVRAGVATRVRGALPLDARFALPVALELHGVERTFEVPVVVRGDERRLRVTGEFDIRQSDFGVEPFSVLGGALRVADELELRVLIEAARWPEGEDAGP